jgi:hypothetical protein
MLGPGKAGLHMGSANPQYSDALLLGFLQHTKIDARLNLVNIGRGEQLISAIQQN